MTNDAGRFNLLNVPAGSRVVRARILGYSPMERTVNVTAGQAVTINFVMETQAVGLKEVVVSVDASVVRRVEVGTDIARLSVEKALPEAAITSVSDLLASRSPGIDVRQSTGPVGTAQPIRVRGVASLSNGSNPVIVLDGIRVSNNTASGPASIDWAEGRTVSRLDDINPNDITSMQVIKGPTATALYGSEAAAGVIIIETKRGQSGATQVQVSNELGWYVDDSNYETIDKHFNLTRYLGITDPNDPVARQFNAVVNPVTNTVWGISNPMTNPLTDPRRTGGTNNTTFSLRGGTQNSKYFISGQAENANGVFVNNWLRRRNARLNLDVLPASTLQLGFSTAFITSNVRLPESSRSFRGYSTNAGVGAPVNSYGVLPGGGRGDCLATLESGANAVTTCDRYQGNLTANFNALNTVFGGQRSGRFIGSMTATWAPVTWISNRVNVGLDNTQNFDLNQFPLDQARPFGSLSAGFIRESRQTTEQQSVEGTSTLTLTPLSNLTSTTTAGAQYFHVDDQWAGCTGEQGFASPTATACNASLVQTGFSGSAENVQVGAYVQQRVGFRDYAFVTGAVRVDDNSAFGAAVGALWSPSFNMSLVLTDMPFWRWSSVSTLRLRGAYGSAAQAPPAYAADERLEPVRLTTGTSTVAAVSALFPGNPDLGPELKSEIELGADLGFFGERLNVRATHFRQKVKDALLSRLLAPSLGYRANQFINVAELRNNGYELGITADVIARRRFSWNVDFSVSTQDPIVTSMGGIAPLFLGNDRGMIVKGFAPGAYYGPTVESATRAADGTIVPGSIVYKDCPDLPLNYCYHGSPQAKDMENFSTTIGLLEGTLRLRTVFDRRGNVTKQNGSSAFLVGFHRDRGGPIEYAFRESRVTPAEQAAMEERLRGITNADSFIWHEDGSFMKWRELSVSYDLPERVTAMLRGHTASVSLAGRNLATWTKYRGIDPESFVRGGLATIGGNEEFFGEAVPRHVQVRINIGTGQ
jgi:TonB-linked SusC/RagA family outer membrane protein